MVSVRRLILLSSAMILALCFSSLMAIRGYSYWGGYYPDITVIPVGEADVAVYVVALNGVGGCGVNDVSRTVEGVIAACQVNSSRYHTGNVNPCTGEYYTEWGPVVLVEIEINTTVSVVSDWDVYEHLVEFGSNIVILNAHGETVPVPSGYTKEA